MNKRQDNLKKIKTIHRIGVVLIAIFSFCLLFPPIVAVFDRSDIWIGIMPLSQFYIILFTGLITAVLYVLYRFDAKYDNDELDMAAIARKEQEGKDNG